MRVKGRYPWGKGVDRPVPTPPIITEEPSGVMATPMLHFNTTIASQSKHRSVMDVEPCCAEDVVLVTRDEIGALEQAYRIPYSMWEDFGSPNKMTVTLEAGDQLNEGGS